MDLSILRLKGEYLTDLGVNGSILLKQRNAVYEYIYIYIYVYDISSLRVNQILYCVSFKIYNKFANYFVN